MSGGRTVSGHELGAASARAPRERDVVIGLMSGTSLDGISAAAVRFGAGDGRRLAAEVVGYTVRPFTPEQRERLHAALERGSPAEYCRLSFDLGEWLAAAAIDVLAESGIARGDVAAVASHGQTIWHEPGHSTWQLGEAAVIAERTGLDVVSDFRVRDVAAGGQGAPLVPIADALLFAADDAWRALQNLGGIGNVTIVPPGGELSGVRAFDTGPGVAVIDGVVRVLVPGTAYDVDGALARRGVAIESVVETFLAEPYFASPPPKSTGRELFTREYIRRFIAACRESPSRATTEDIVATAVRFTAASVGDAYRRFVPEPVRETVLSGGGAKNPALVEAIAAAVAPLEVRRFEEVFFDGEAKEAVAFALMGWLHLRHEPANVPGATGARGPRILGKRTPA
ncbi:MAG TPA: anhydro-N-acetylmuramic acid kinase [Gemmatimonadaceae bacterium]|nr:anhydro-N-acetylmuramic acid kinase [Gemmatimonadaceae bacterium]